MEGIHSLKRRKNKRQTNLLCNGWKTIVTFSSIFNITWLTFRCRCSLAQTVMRIRPPTRKILANSLNALTRLSLVARWLFFCLLLHNQKKKVVINEIRKNSSFLFETYWMTAIDNAASKLSSRYGRLRASQISTCSAEITTIEPAIYKHMLFLFYSSLHYI